MSLSGRTRFRVLTCAPAVVVLATVVNAAASDQDFALSPQPSTDLSWAVRGGVAHSGRSAGVLIAKKAAKTIDSADRISGARVDFVRVEIEPDSPRAETRPRGIFLSPAQQNTRSTHQHSAP